LVELPEEYWRERTLMEIASVVGIPIDLDVSTRNKGFLTLCENFGGH